MNGLPWTYPAIMALAILASLAISRSRQQRLGLTATQRLAIGLGAFCGSLIGAKLPFLLADWDGLASGRAFLENGKTIVMGLAGGYLGVEMAKWSCEIRVKTGDSFALAAAVALGIGRLSCFVGGCCYGTPTSLPWAFDFGDGVPRHPTQLYEAAFHLACAAVLLGLERRQLLGGQRIKAYILAYLVYRFFTEWIRPEPKLWQGLTGYQWASLALMPVFVGLWLRDRKPASELSGAQPAPANSAGG